METNTEHKNDRNEPILVTGGTGTLGRLVVARLRDAGRDVRVLSRQAREPEQGVELVSGRPRHRRGHRRRGRGRRDDRPPGRRPEGRRREGPDTGHGGVAGRRPPPRPHLGRRRGRVPVASRVDRAMFGYFESKRAAEEVVAGSGVPWTTLRATQFHDLMLATARGMARLPVIPVPSGFRFQPVEADEVAARLVSLRSPSRPAWCPTSPGHGCTTCPSWSAATPRQRQAAARAAPAPARPPRLRAGANLSPGPRGGPRQLGGLPGRARRRAGRAEPEPGVALPAQAVNDEH